MLGKVSFRGPVWKKRDVLEQFWKEKKGFVFSLRVRLG
jgi:hypothetical protein